MAALMQLKWSEVLAYTEYNASLAGVHPMLCPRLVHSVCGKFEMRCLAAGVQSSGWRRLHRAATLRIVACLPVRYVLSCIAAMCQGVAGPAINIVLPTVAVRELMV